MREGTPPGNWVLELRFEVTDKQEAEKRDTGLRESLGFPGDASDKEPACQCKRHKRHSLVPWVGKISWRKRAWQPTAVCLPGKSRGQRSLVGYSPWGHNRVGQDLATKQPSQVFLTHVRLRSASEGQRAAPGPPSSHCPLLPTCKAVPVAEQPRLHMEITR